MSKSSWFKRRWFDFRMGHNTYLSFLLSFTNFLLICYNFLVSKIPILSDIFSNIWIFALVGAILYIPLATYIGHLHNAKQLKTDILIREEKNPYYELILSRLEDIEKKLE